MVRDLPMLPVLQRLSDAYGFLLIFNSVDRNKDRKTSQVEANPKSAALQLLCAGTYSV